MTPEHAHGTVTIPLHFAPNYSYFTLNLHEVYIHIAHILKNL